MPGSLLLALLLDEVLGRLFKVHSTGPDIALNLDILGLSTLRDADLTLTIAGVLGDGFEAGWIHGQYESWTECDGDM